MKKILLFCFVLSAYLSSPAQKVRLNIFENKRIVEDTVFPSLQHINKYLHNQITYYRQNGYLLANIDSITCKTDSSCSAYIYIGKHFSFEKVQLKISDSLPLNLSAVKPKYYRKKPVDLKTVQELTQDILSYFENNGYPYVSVSWKDVKNFEDKISATLSIDKGHRVLIDSIVIHGNIKISESFIYNKLELFPGDLYNQKNIDAIEKKIDELPFVRLAKKPKISYKKENVSIHLFLEKKKAGKFNGIIGFMPDIQTGKTVITGDVNLNIINALGKGEDFYFQWRRIQQNTQNLNLKVKYPYLLNTKLGINSFLSIYKRDTLFNNSNFRLGLDYLFSGKFTATGFYELEQSAVLSTITQETLNNIQQLPYKTSYYGLEIKWLKTDYIYNPLKGLEINIFASAGEKKFTNHPQIPRTFTDSINKGNLQFKNQLKISTYIPTGKQTTIHLGITAGNIYGKSLVMNEFFRIGGLNTLRGFNEESIFASTFSIATVEWRYLFEKNAAAFIFFDGAFYEQNLPEQYSKDFPYGFGFGINFETKAGIFNLAYALGSEKNNPIEIRNAKIHFGFVNFF